MLDIGQKFFCACINSYLTQNPEKSDGKILRNTYKNPDLWQFWIQLAHFSAKINFLDELVSFQILHLSTIVLKMSDYHKIL